MTLKHCLQKVCLKNLGIKEKMTRKLYIRFQDDGHYGNKLILLHFLKVKSDQEMPHLQQVITIKSLYLSQKKIWTNFCKILKFIWASHLKCQRISDFWSQDIKGVERKHRQISYHSNMTGKLLTGRIWYKTE